MDAVAMAGLSLRDRVLCALLVAQLIAVPAFADPEKLAVASMDRVNATTVVPDPSRKMGEVRLVERGDAVVVQTLLATKLLSRVLSEIGRKEEGNWPKDNGPSRQYLDGLKGAKATLDSESARRDRPRTADRRQRLLIEFAADKEDAVVLIGTFESDPDAAKLKPERRRLFSRLTLPRDYVLRNMRLILADSFRLAERDVDRLGPLGPASAALVPPVPAEASAPNGAAPEAPEVPAGAFDRKTPPAEKR